MLRFNVMCGSHNRDNVLTLNRAASKGQLPGVLGGPLAVAPEEAVSSAMHLSIDIGALEARLYLF